MNKKSEKQSKNPSSSEKSEKQAEFFRILMFCFPFIVFHVFGVLEQSITYPQVYPYVYVAKIIMTMLVVSLCMRYWQRDFPFRISGISWMAIPAGVAGVVLWVGVCKLGLEAKVLAVAGMKTEVSAVSGETAEKLSAEEINALQKATRSGFNPFTAWPKEPDRAWVFFAFRMLGLALVVPLMEEFFLRGFLLRYVHDQNWTAVGMGVVSGSVWLATIIYAVVSHPGEAVAAALWFSMITWLVMRTKNIWDAVTAHVVTNFLLGMWVLYSGEWYFL